MDELDYEIYALSPENKDAFQRFFRQKRYETIRNELKAVAGKGSSVLDIGCGAGISTLWLAKEGFDITGADLNKKFVDYANSEAKKQGLRARFFHADITRNFREFNSKFDVVIASEVLEHVEDYNRAVSNISGYVKNGGHLIVTVPNFHGMAGITEFLWAMRARYNWVHEHKHDICCPKRIEIVLKNNGMTPTRTYTVFYASHFTPFISGKLASFIFDKEKKYIGGSGLGELLISVSKKSW